MSNQGYQAGNYCGSVQLLIKNADQLRPLFNHKRFTINDLDPDDFDTKRPADYIRMLKEGNAIEKVDEKEITGSRGKSRLIGVWEWNEGLWNRMMDYYDNRNELPCGCRVQFQNERGVDGYSCKACGAVYSREVIEQFL